MIIDKGGGAKVVLRKNLTKTVSQHNIVVWLSIQLLGSLWISVTAGLVNFSKIVKQAPPQAGFFN